MVLLPLQQSPLAVLFESGATADILSFPALTSYRGTSQTNTSPFLSFAFAVASIRRWWNAMGRRVYGEAEELFITADAGGSNGYRSRAWKHELQRFADETKLKIRVSHFPPGTSKWNKIEHRLFGHITQNWRGKPLRSFETIVDLISNTRTAKGLRVKAKLDKRTYPTGVSIPKAEMDALSLHRREFQGDWNYEIHPRTT